MDKEESLEDIEKDMKPKLIGETWRKYPTDTSKQKATYGLYECQYCGEEFKCQTSHIKNRGTISCGCQKNRIIKEQHSINISHGMAKHRFYDTWRQMVQRCTNPNLKRYKDYGGRGITVCEEWLDIKNFIAWAESTHPKLEGYTLDRINNDKGYSPENCTWSDKTAQAINQRIQKNNKSGYVGVRYHSRDGVWTANIGINNKSKHIGQFSTIEEAVLARDNYIVENKLPHKLSILNTGL